MKENQAWKVTKKKVLAALSHKTKTKKVMNKMPFASNIQSVPDAFVL